MAFIKVMALNNCLHIINTDMIIRITRRDSSDYLVEFAGSPTLHILPAEMEKIFAAIGQRL